MIGSSGTVTEPSLLAMIFAPLVGGWSLSYDAMRSLLEPAVYRAGPRFATAPAGLRVAIQVPAKSAGRRAARACESGSMSARLSAITALLACLSACGDDSNSRPDASTRPSDAAPPDAEPPPDAAVREGIWYLMDAIRVPQSANEANEVALDI